MKTGMGLLVLVVGLTGLQGCGADGGSEATLGEPVGSESEALVGIPKGIRRDYDGDGKEDVIFSEQNGGSAEWLGLSPSGLSGNAWSQADLPAGTGFHYGDFNGDGKSDLLITTSTLTYSYIGKAGGGFLSTGWVNTGITTTDNASILMGDFNNDNRTDFLLTAPSGTFEYAGQTNGGFSNVWSKAAWSRGNVVLTRGDFNGDGFTDVLVTNGTDTREYTGQATGFSTNSVWSTTLFKISGVPNASFYPADYNGDHVGDVLIFTGTGITLYTGKTAGGFTVDAWTSTISNRTDGSAVAGDFDGDGRWDFLLASHAGAYEYLAKTTGSGFNSSASWQDTTKHVYDSTFTRGDYNGDGKDDFLVMTDTFGAFEYTGKTGGNFNQNVWSNSTLDRQDNFN